MCKYYLTETKGLRLQSSCSSRNPKPGGPFPPPSLARGPRAVASGAAPPLLSPPDCPRAHPHAHCASVHGGALLRGHQRPWPLSGVKSFCSWFGSCEAGRGYSSPAQPLAGAAVGPSPEASNCLPATLVVPLSHWSVPQRAPPPSPLVHKRSLKSVRDELVS